MAEAGERIRVLLSERAEVRARMAQIPFDGHIEVKENASGKYLYARSRVAGRNTSTYLDVYSEEAHALLMAQAAEKRALKKALRKIERDLASLGHEEADLPPRALLNIDFARANVKTLIYGQAVLEGVSTTFPQTEEIIENGVVSGMKASDVQKILNLKHAWEFILDRDVAACPSDFSVLSRVASLVNEGFYEYGGRVRFVPVKIGGCSWAPPIPTEDGVRQLIADTTGAQAPAGDVAILLVMRLMRTQAFIDGNKRASVIFANHYMIARGAGLLSVPEEAAQEFRSRLVEYYESGDEARMLAYMQATCLMEL